MAINGSGIRDTARVLKISTTTVLNELKKEPEIKQINTQLVGSFSNQPITVQLYKVKDKEINKVEIDEIWSFVGKKKSKNGCGML